MEGSQRIGKITAALQAVAGERFSTIVLETSPGSGDYSMQYVPHRPDAAQIIVTDTQVSWYIELRGAHWEADSSETDPAADFETQTRWAIDTCVGVARFGVARIRSKWQPFGRTSIVLTSNRQMDDALANRSNLVLVRRWQPW